MLTRYYEVDVAKLERLLIQKGWPVSEIARRGVFSQRRLDQIMAGNGRVFRSNLKALADLFGVQPEELIKAGPNGVQREQSEAATFTANLSGVPEGFDETSIYVAKTLAAIRQTIHAGVDVVDFVMNGDKARITFEISNTSLMELFSALVSGQIKAITPTEGPDEIPMGAGGCLAPLLFWADEITFPDDCPFEPLRGKVVTKTERFCLKP